MTTPQERLEFLRKFFTISTAAMTFTNTVSVTFGGKVSDKAAMMQDLHVRALNLILVCDKTDEGCENCIKSVERLLEQMELLAQTVEPTPFQPGGIISKANGGEYERTH